MATVYNIIMVGTPSEWVTSQLQSANKLAHTSSFMRLIYLLGVVYLHPTGLASLHAVHHHPQSQ